jgi:hypothetical protein
MPAMGGVPAAFVPSGVTSYFRAHLPDVPHLDLSGDLYRLDATSLKGLATGMIHAFDRDGQRLPQIYRPGTTEQRHTRLEDVDLSGLEASGRALADQLREAEREIEAEVETLVRQFEEQLAMAQQELATLHRQLDGLVRHQLMAEWAWLEADFDELVDMLAVVRAGHVLDGRDGAALREAVRHGRVSVLRARAELGDLLDLASCAVPTFDHQERLAWLLDEPLLGYWLQTYVRGHVQLMLARSLLLYACGDTSAVRAGQLRQRLLEQSAMWSRDAETLTGYARLRVELPDASQLPKAGVNPMTWAGGFRRMKAQRRRRTINDGLEELETMVGVVAVPLRETWAGLPASVGVQLPFDLS